MKKFLLLILLFSGILIAQQWQSNDSTGNYTKGNFVVNSEAALGRNPYDLRAQIVYPVNLVYNLLDSLKMGNDSTDARDTVYITFTEAYKYIFITLPDTGEASGSGGLSDSVTLFAQDPNTEEYYQVRLVEVADGDTVTTLVPGSGNTAAYVLANAYPSKLMIVYANTGG